MNSQNEFIGFIIGSDIYNEKEVWKVRCDNKNSKFFQKKFIIATYKIALVKGMVVKFKLAKVLVSDEKILQAVEVDIYI